MYRETGWSSPWSPGGERNTDIAHSTSSREYAGRVSLADRTSLMILITLKTPSLVSLRMNILGAPVAGLTIAFHVSILCIFFVAKGEGGQLPETFEEDYKTGVVSLVAGNRSNNQSQRGKGGHGVGPGCRMGWEGKGHMTWP